MFEKPLAKMVPSTSPLSLRQRFFEYKRLSIMSGWIKVHRSIKEWEWFRDAQTLQLFIFLLCEASHKGTRRFGIEVKRGQVLTGLIELSRNTGISIQSLRTRIKRLKSTGEITSKSTNKYSLITVVRYDEYQNKDDDQQANQQANQQTTNKQPTNNQQLSKNVKNEKNVRRVGEPPTLGKYSHIGSITDRELDDLAYRTNKPRSLVDETWEKLKLHIQAEGKQYQNVRAALELWVKREKGPKKIIVA